jgi:hypothetical protein
VEVGGKEGRGEEAVEGTTYVWAPTWRLPVHPEGSRTIRRWEANNKNLEIEIYSQSKRPDRHYYFRE